MRRLGPCGKGRGESDKSKGEGKGGGAAKGGGNGKGETDKGKGKGNGYQGTCWKCGKVGHKSAECRQIGTVDEEGNEEDNEEEEVEVHAVWNIGSVDIAKTKGQIEIHDGGYPGALVVEVGKVESTDVDGGTKHRTKSLKDHSQDKSIKIALDSGAGVGC